MRSGKLTSRREFLRLVALGSASTAVVAACAPTATPTPAPPPKPTEAPKPAAATAPPKPTQAPAAAAKPTEAPKPSEALKPTAAATSAPKPALSGEITFWHSYTQEVRIRALETIIGSFTKANAGVKVKTEAIPWSGFQAKWTAAQAAGTMPDMSTALLSQALLMAEAGATQPANPVIDALGGKGAFIEQPLQNLSYKGVYIGVPHYTHCRLLFYRKDWLQEMSLKVPGTWDELMDAAVKTTKEPERYGFIMPMAKGGPGRIILYIMMLTNDAHYFDASGNVTFNSPATVEAVTFFMDLYQKASPSGSTSYDTTTMKNLFQTGKTNFFVETAFTLSEVEQAKPELASPEKIGAVAFPPKKQPGVMAELIALVLSKTTRNLETTKAFMVTLFGGDNYVSFLHSMPGGQFPSTKAIAESPTFFKNPIIEKFKDIVQLSIDGTKIGTPVGMSKGVTLKASVLDTGLVEEMLQAIVTDKKPVEKAVAETHSLIERQIAEQKL